MHLESSGILFFLKQLINHMTNSVLPSALNATGPSTSSITFRACFYKGNALTHQVQHTLLESVKTPLSQIFFMSLCPLTQQNYQNSTCINNHRSLIHSNSATPRRQSCRLLSTSPSPPAALSRPPFLDSVHKIFLFIQHN